MEFILMCLLAVFIGTVLARASCFNPKPQPKTNPQPVCFDKDAAVDALARLIRCKTVSHYDHSLEDDAEFEKLIHLLPQLYPHVFEVCEFQQLPDRALLLRWPGKQSGNPSVMMAHYDVVPVNEENWEMPAFDGIIADGVLWGRGTLDTKGTVNGVLFAANHLISEGFRPEHDMYFAFSGGEEVNGRGAPNIVQYFVDHGLEPSIVVDEGGAVVEGVFPGVKQPCAVVGIAEKGMLNAQYRTVSAGGHASAPRSHTPVGILAAACKKVEDHPFPMHLTKPAAEMFDTLGRHSTLLYRIIFANLWCFGWVLDLLGKKSGGEMNALLRTTSAFTQMEGSTAPNVIPPDAKMVANMRLNPADSVASALDYLRKTVGDPTVEITAVNSFEPSRISRTDCEAWKMLEATVAETWPGVIVTPYLMVACSDARHWGRISDKVYRFCPMEMSNEDRATIHGNNERIRLDCIAQCVEFYIRLIKKL